MNRPTFVVVFGNSDNGKDSLADEIAVQLNMRGQTAVRCAFADPLKETALSLLGIPLEVSYANASVKESTSYYGSTVRYWLQWLGTEVGRDQIHRDVWVHRLADRGLARGAPFVVVSDGRFENERVGLREYLGDRGRVFNVLIHRPSQPIPGPGTHASEAEVADLRRRALGGELLFDAVVENSGELADLDAEAGRLSRLIEAVSSCRA